MIKWEKIMENERSRFEKMNERDKFIYFLLLQYGSPYGWGKENPESSDCSGAVCMALYAATGYFVRTTADGLYRNIFTWVNPRPDEIRAVFYLTRQGKKHGDGFAPAGTAVHTAGILEDGIILNSQEPYAKVRRIVDVSDWFQKSGHDVVIRGLDRAALKTMAEKGNKHGVDREMAKYFSMSN
jgi:murein DD-endopeptidase